MKKIYFVCMLCLSGIIVSAQQPVKYYFQVITFDQGKDKNRDMQRFYRMNIESNSVRFPEFSKLVHYFETRNTPSRPGTYYLEKADTSVAYYNYFLSVSQGLTYLSDNNWEFVGSASNVREYDERTGTQISYLFRKPQ